MEIKIENLSAEKAKNGEIYVYFSDNRLSSYRILVAHIRNKAGTVSWLSEDGVTRSAII